LHLHCEREIAGRISIGVGERKYFLVQKSIRDSDGIGVSDRD